MHKNFVAFGPNFADCMKSLRLNEDNEFDCVCTTGFKFLNFPFRDKDHDPSNLEIFVAAGLVTSKGDFKRNVRPLWINGTSVNAHDPFRAGVRCVLTTGKTRDGFVVWWSNAEEDESEERIFPKWNWIIGIEISDPNEIKFSSSTFLFLL